MDWATAFYAWQDELVGVYTGGMADDGTRRAETLTRLAGGGRKRVLELGAGGGQAAVKAADLGHDVVAVELVPTAAEHARCLAERDQVGSLTVVCGNFYEVDPGGPFDVVCYWDGFGVGGDGDQRRLLRRIRGWLAEDGVALVDVNTPWYWAAAAGREMTFDRVSRRYGFDADGCRMLDRWWASVEEDAAVTQSLRCYAPADLRLLLEDTGLRLESVEPGGAVDYDAGRLSDRAVALVVKLSAEAAVRDPDRYAGHSLRAGQATSAAAPGISERVIANQTQHRSVEVLRRFIRGGSLCRDTAAGSVGR